jgi:hypothetical protein
VMLLERSGSRNLTDAFLRHVGREAATAGMAPTS